MHQVNNINSGFRREDGVGPASHAFWKNDDPRHPILKEPRAEYAKLQQQGKVLPWRIGTVCRNSTFPRESPY
jgi:hypothetical protein